MKINNVMGTNGAEPRKLPDGDLMIEIFSRLFQSTFDDNEEIVSIDANAQQLGFISLNIVWANGSMSNYLVSTKNDMKSTNKNYN